MKKIFACLLLLCLLATLVAIPGCQKPTDETPPAKEPASEGLTFELSQNRQYYVLTGMGSCRDTKLVIPSTHLGLPVRAIAAGAFRTTKSATLTDSGNALTLLEQVTDSGAEGEITEVVIPDGITDIGDEAFAGCDKLRDVQISDLVSKIGTDAFKDTAFYREASNWQNGALYLEGYLVAVREDLTGTLTVADGTRQIADGAASGCGITGVVLPSSLRIIGKRAFASCTALSRVDLSVAALTVCEEAFAGCTALTEAIIGNDEIPTTVPKDDLPTMTTVNGSVGGVLLGPTDATFYYANAAVLYIDPTFVFSTVVEKRAFADCTSLTTLSFGTNVHYLGAEVFAGCTALKAVDMSRVTAPADQTPILHPRGVSYSTMVLSGAFKDCTSLTDVKLPQGLTALYETFSGCTALADITLPDSLTIIGPAAFRNCTALATVHVPDTVTHILSDAFSGLPATAEISLGYGVVAISERAFVNVPAIHYRGTVTQWSQVGVSSMVSGVDGIPVTVHCIDGTTYT